jgi:hypothetical protein
VLLIVIKGTYTITQADIDAGKVVNTLATAKIREHALELERRHAMHGYPIDQTLMALVKQLQ